MKPSVATFLVLSSSSVLAADNKPLEVIISDGEVYAASGSAIVSPACAVTRVYGQDTDIVPIPCPTASDTVQSSVFDEAVVVNGSTVTLHVGASDVDVVGHSQWLDEGHKSHYTSDGSKTSALAATQSLNGATASDDASGSEIMPSLAASSAIGSISSQSVAGDAASQASFSANQSADQMNNRPSSASESIAPSNAPPISASNAQSSATSLADTIGAKGPVPIGPELSSDSQPPNAHAISSSAGGIVPVDTLSIRSSPLQNQPSVSGASSQASVKEASPGSSSQAGPIQTPSQNVGPNGVLSPSKAKGEATAVVTKYSAASQSAIIVAAKDVSSSLGAFFPIVAGYIDHPEDEKKHDDATGIIVGILPKVDALMAQLKPGPGGKGPDCSVTPNLIKGLANIGKCVKDIGTKLVNALKRPDPDIQGIEKEVESLKGFEEPLVTEKPGEDEDEDDDDDEDEDEDEDEKSSKPDKKESKTKENESKSTPQSAKQSESTQVPSKISAATTHTSSFSCTKGGSCGSCPTTSFVLPSDSDIADATYEPSMVSGPVSDFSDFESDVVSKTGSLASKETDATSLNSLVSGSSISMGSSFSCTKGGSCGSCPTTSFALPSDSDMADATFEPSMVTGPVSDFESDLIASGGSGTASGAKETGSSSIDTPASLRALQSEASPKDPPSPPAPSDAPQKHEENPKGPSCKIASSLNFSPGTWCTSCDQGATSNAYETIKDKTGDEACAFPTIPVSAIAPVLTPTTAASTTVPPSCRPSPTQKVQDSHENAVVKAAQAFCEQKVIGKSQEYHGWKDVEMNNKQTGHVFDSLKDDVYKFYVRTESLCLPFTGKYIMDDPIPGYIWKDEQYDFWHKKAKAKRVDRFVSGGSKENGQQKVGNSKPACFDLMYYAWKNCPNKGRGGQITAGCMIYGIETMN